MKNGFLFIAIFTAAALIFAALGFILSAYLSQTLGVICYVISLTALLTDVILITIGYFKFLKKK